MNSTVLAYPELMPMYFLFFDINNNFTHIIPYSYSFLESETVSDDDDVSIPFLFLISKVKSFSSYQLKDLFMFHVDVDADLDFKDSLNDSEWTLFLEMDSSQIIKQYFKSIPFLNDITISPSLSLFHSLNSLFFILKEKPKSNLPKLVFVENIDNNCPVESIEDTPLSIIHKTRKHHTPIKRLTVKNH